MIGQPFARRADSLLRVQLADVLEELQPASAACAGDEVVEDGGLVDDKARSSPMR